MDLKDIGKQKKLVNQAKTNYESFIDVQHDNNKKSNFIGYWLLSHSNHLLSETNLKKTGFIVYRPGTLIRVDFGVNVGSEISGAHFAVVLNKRDNEYNSILNVIPLTSKNKSNNIDIGLEVFDRVIENCRKDIQKFIIVRDEFVVFYDIVNKMAILEDTNPELNVLMVQFLELLCTRVEENFDSSKFNLLNEEEKKQFVQLMTDKYTTHLLSMDTQINDFKKIVETYTNKYRNNTYVDMSQVTTVSKLRIMSRINQFDPMGSIQVKDTILNQIRDELRKRII